MSPRLNHGCLLATHVLKCRMMSLILKSSVDIQTELVILMVVDVNLFLTNSI